MEKVWQYFAMAVIAIALGITSYKLVSPKHVVRYELGSSYHGIPVILADVENGPDYNIELSKEVSWNEAVILVDSLNQNIQKYPIK
jgi:hypothetical protein